MSDLLSVRRLNEGVPSWNAHRIDTEWIPNLAGSQLEAIDLTGCDFTDAKLKYVMMTFSGLDSAIFCGADLTRSQLDGSSFQSATFTGARLCDARMTGTNLTYATFVNADLRGVHLHGADLSWANLENAVLNGASADNATKWPIGFQPPSQVIQRDREH